jgi:hypothetical protein
MTSDEYQQAIGELARRATMPDAAAARMEARLAQAFESAAARPEGEPARPRNVFRPLAAAAAILIMLGAGVWYARRQAVTSNDVTNRSADSRADLKTIAADQSELKVDAADKVHPKVNAPEGGGSGSRGVRLPGYRKPPKRLPPVIRPQGFVAVPTAARLPQFESGVIVRMSLPVAALPSYGVDISPASSADAVEADVLVAQDGVARAIRLVNSSRSQQ